MHIVYWIWFILVFISFVLTIVGTAKQPISWVQKLGWVLVVAYTGPFGYFFYRLTCHGVTPDLHEEYIKPLWKQAVNSEVHCVAGDATGIILSAIILWFVVLPNGTELVIEYIAAFLFGWFIFQAGMMRNMYGSYQKALTKTFFAEGVSMNMVMLGMIPVMVVLMQTLKHAHDPASPAFWFAMGMATIVGSLTAFHINYWLVKNKLKHGCMTIHPEGHEAMHNHGQMDHQMGDISFTKKAIVFIGTYVVLFAVVWLVAQYYPLKF